MTTPLPDTLLPVAGFSGRSAAFARSRVNAPSSPGSSSSPGSNGHDAAFGEGQPRGYGARGEEEGDGFDVDW